MTEFVDRLEHMTLDGRHGEIVELVADLRDQTEGVRQRFRTALAAARYITKGEWDKLVKDDRARQDRDDDDESERTHRDPPQAVQLVILAEELFRFVLGTGGRPYAVEREGMNVALPLRGANGVRQRLARVQYRRTGTVPSSGALADALHIIEGETTELDPEPVGLRVAHHGQAVVLDLGDATGRAVVVSPRRWEIETRSPVLFRRTKLTDPLPEPAKISHPEVTRVLDLFRALVNIDEDGFRLIVAWELAALIPDMPHPILALTGEQGTAKTTAMRLCLQLINPSPAPTQSAPADQKAWAVLATASWTVGLDNLSAIPEWLSDALCKAVTGDGTVQRELYTDDDVNVLSFQRVIAFTSIDSGVRAGDLAERLLPVDLELIRPDARRADAAISAAFQRDRPKILGALLTLLADVLDELPNVHLDELPRMADFALMLAALDRVTGWETLTAYLGRTATANADVLESSAFGTAVAKLVNREGRWSGTTDELLRALKKETDSDSPPRGWPKNPRAATTQLQRLAPALRNAGINYTKLPRLNRARLIELVCSEALEPQMLAGMTVTTDTTVTGGDVFAGQQPFYGGDESLRRP